MRDGRWHGPSRQFSPGKPALWSDLNQLACTGPTVIQSTFAVQKVPCGSASEDKATVDMLHDSGPGATGWPQKPGQ